MNNLGKPIRILAIDPGPTKSAFVIWDVEAEEILDKGIVPNLDLLLKITSRRYSYDIAVIEMVESFGMAVGKEIFETVFWIGRFFEAIDSEGPEPMRIPRKDIKMHLCGTMRAKDGNIRQALIDRFGSPGKKKEPGILYGVSKDIWSATAIAVTCADMV